MVTPRDWWHECVHETNASTFDKNTHFQNGKETCGFCQLGFHLISDTPVYARFVFQKPVYENQLFSYSLLISTFQLTISSRGPPCIS